MSFLENVFKLSGVFCLDTICKVLQKVHVDWRFFVVEQVDVKFPNFCIVYNCPVDSVQLKGVGAGNAALSARMLPTLSA
jgi:hypothetical protein